MFRPETAMEQRLGRCQRTIGNRPTTTKPAFASAAAAPQGVDRKATLTESLSSRASIGGKEKLPGFSAKNKSVETEQWLTARKMGALNWLRGNEETIQEDFHPLTESKQHTGRMETDH